MVFLEKYKMGINWLFSKTMTYLSFSLSQFSNTDWTDWSDIDVQTLISMSRNLFYKSDTSNLKIKLLQDLQFHKPNCKFNNKNYIMSFTKQQARCHDRQVDWCRQNILPIQLRIHHKTQNYCFPFLCVMEDSSAGLDFSAANPSEYLVSSSVYID